MLRSNSKQSGGIHVEENPEEEKGEAATCLRGQNSVRLLWTRVAIRSNSSSDVENTRVLLCK